MRGFHRYVAMCALILTALPSIALSAAAIDWTGCALPIFGADKRAAIVACTSILNRTDLSNADRERALIIRGRAAHRDADIDSAIRDFDAAIALAPKDPEPLVRRASAAFFKKDYGSAVELAERALRLNPKYAEAHDILGTVALVTGNYGMAKSEYDKAIELDPGSVVARHHRIELLIAAGAQP